MKIKIILLSLIVLLFTTLICTIKINNSNNLKIKQDILSKVRCDCIEILAEDWKSRICYSSCNDFCHENEDVKKACLGRCENNLCSQVGDSCDITEDSGIGGCISIPNLQSPNNE